MLISRQPHRCVLVGDADNYPMEWLDGKNGVYKGTYQDVLKLLAQNSGLTMEMTYTPDMASSWELLADGRVMLFPESSGRKNWRPNTIFCTQTAF